MLRAELGPKLTGGNVIVERERGLLEVEKRIADLRSANINQPVDFSAEIAALEQKYETLQREIFGSLTPWERVNMARHPSRPTTLDYIAQLDRFDELHGDRQFRDDPAIVGGFALLHGRASWRSDSNAAAIRRKTCAATSAWLPPRGIARCSA